MLGRLNPEDLRNAFPGLAARFAKPNRRFFLKAAALGGAGFVVGCGQQAVDSAIAPEMAGEALSKAFNAFVRVSDDNTVTVLLKFLDMGQGVTTGLTTIVAEEMDADWSQMRWAFAPADVDHYVNRVFGVQGTGGSTAIRDSWAELRQAGAAARAMLIEAAAAEWGVPASEITAAKGVLSHPSGQNGAFGDFAVAASTLTPPTEPSLKDPSQFNLIGSQLPRIDSPEKSTGKAMYTIDTSRPGMLHAAIQHPPKFGGKVASFDPTAALETPGVVDVVEIPRGVAILAESFYAALQGRQALTVDWDLSEAETRGSDELLAEYRALAETPGVTARATGDVDAAFANAAQVIEANYEFPFLAHAPLEPMNAIVELRENECEIWSASQLQTIDQWVVAELTGLKPEQVKINTLLAGGSFGRRAVQDSDYIAEAVMIAKAINGRAPVKLQWSRENDMKGGRYRPLTYVALKGALDADGNITAWSQNIVTQSFVKDTPFEALIVDGVDMTSVEGAADMPYPIPNLRVDVHNPDVGVPTLWWRSVGHTHTGFTTEAFLDELARAGGKDPIELRREMLRDHPRHLGVLELALANAGPAPTGPGRGRGVAVHESFVSFVAQIADVTLNSDGTYKVDRVVCAVDCGVAINPDIVKAQMEGGIGFGLGAAMREAVTLTDGEVDQSNFYDYFPLRMDDMPEVEVHIVPSAEAPSGVGEPGVPTIGPAVANALLAAGAQPVHKLPIGDRVTV